MIKRSDPKNISNTLKEAVAESLLGNIYQSVAGESHYGECVIGNRPSSKFVSGFLEPTYVAKRGGLFVDEITNPVHIITLGLDFQAKNSEAAEFYIHPKFSIYVRVLPTTEDLQKHKIHLELTSGVERAIRDAKWQFSEQYKKQNLNLLAENKNAFYKMRQEELNKITIKVLTEQFKVDFRNDIISEKKSSCINEEEVLTSSLLREGDSIDELNEDNAGGVDHLGQDILFIAYPGMSSSIPDDVMDRVSPLQKWIRLDLDDLPKIKVPVVLNEGVLEQLIVKHSAELKEAIANKIAQWLKDVDSLTGGQLWAFPKGLKLTPNQIKHWDDTLLNIRKEYHAKTNASLFSIPAIDLRWNIEMTDQYDNPNIRTIRVALENCTDMEQVNRTEVEESLQGLHFTTLYK